MGRIHTRYTFYKVKIFPYCFLHLTLILRSLGTLHQKYCFGTPILSTTTAHLQLLLTSNNLKSILHQPINLYQILQQKSSLIFSQKSCFLKNDVNIIITLLMVPENHQGIISRFKRIIWRQKFRYTKMGYGFYLSLILAFILFRAVPWLLQLIWPSLLENTSTSIIYGVGILFANLIIFIPYNLVMMYVYKSKNPFFQQYRVYNKPWPWQEDPIKWRITLKKSIISIFFNVFFFAQILTVYEIWNGLTIKFGIDEFPSTLTILWQMMVFIIAQDFTFYLTHSTLHNPKLYWIHKQHHQYNNTITLAAQYAHPLQYMFGNVIPFGIGFKLLSRVCPVHMITVLVWSIYRIIQTSEGHSGYEWSWNISHLLPFGAGPDYHNFHHSRNTGNYGSMFVLWDTIWGTNNQYEKIKELQDIQFQKKQL